MAHDIGPGDAVFVPSFTFAATAEVVALRRAEPVFVDVGIDTYNMDVASLKAAISMVKAEGRLQPKAIIPVDLFGLPADMEAITAIAREEGLIVIEDAAQSIGGKLGNTMCAISATSPQPASTRPSRLAAMATAAPCSPITMKWPICCVRSISMARATASTIMCALASIHASTPIQAAILIEKLAILEDEMEARQRVASRYADGLRDVVKVPQLVADRRSAWAQYAIEVDGRDGLKAHLHKNSIPSVIYYTKPLHQQVAYEMYPVAPDGLPVTEALPGKILCLPMHPYLSSGDQDMIIDCIRQYVLANGREAAE